MTASMPPRNLIVQEQKISDRKAQPVVASCDSADERGKCGDVGGDIRGARSLSDLTRSADGAESVPPADAGSITRVLTDVSAPSHRARRTTTPPLPHADARSESSSGGRTV